MNGTNTPTTASSSAHHTASKPPAAPLPDIPHHHPPPQRSRNHVDPNHTHTTVNGPQPQNHGHNHNHKGHKHPKPSPPSPTVVYDSLKARISALESAEILEEEVEKQYADEAQKSVKGMEDKAIHTKFVELFAELKRAERDHAKEKQKLVKDKDAAKGQLTKANQTKSKMENLARELQKENKRLREDGKRLAQSVDEAKEELAQVKIDVAQRADKAKVQDVKYREMPDIVVKVLCRYRAELFFKISRKTKLSRLFNAWSDRMEASAPIKQQQATEPAAPKASPPATAPATNGSLKSDAPSTNATAPSPAPTMQFVFTHNGRAVESDQSPEEAGMEDGDEILAVELMDLTEGTEDFDELVEPRRQELKKNWTNDPTEAKRSMEQIFDGVVRERLKEVLRQYELRERHFECVIRSKELEVLLSRARAAEQKQLAEGEKMRGEKLEEECRTLKKELEDSQHGQTTLIDKLIICCKEPNAAQTQRLLASLRDELEKRGGAGVGGSTSTSEDTRGMEGRAEDRFVPAPDRHSDDVSEGESFQGDNDQGEEEEEEYEEEYAEDEDDDDLPLLLSDDDRGAPPLVPVRGVSETAVGG